MEKLEIWQWQFEEMVGLLTATCRNDNKEAWDHIWAWSKEHFKIIQRPVLIPEMPTKYVFFGYKQDATRYRLEHDIDPKDMILARDWKKLEGLRARIVRVNMDGEWSRLNWYHEHHYNARGVCNHIESMCGG
ncbi:hypothetical protein SEA_CATERPILLAR_78 [Arthrobacter phage Caterpillar]|nr:hypothetical protein SEA_CATERPILLAR_78 [Arthrobacter phage Caterpillar]